MDDNLLKEARVLVSTAIVVTGRQAPYDLEQRAGELLAAVWQASEPFGVAPEDWAATAARLPTSCVDVLAAVQRRPRAD